MTRREVSQRWGVSIATIKNWSNGFYYRRGKKKIFYLSTRDHLEFTRTELGQPMFAFRDVQRWIRQLKLNQKNRA